MAGVRKPPSVAMRPGEEVWETATEGMVYVLAVDDRGRERTLRAGGRIGDRLRIATADRQIAQEGIRYKANDPFVNGTLVRVDADQQVDEDTASPNALTPAEMRDLFSLQGSDFTETLPQFSEVVLRRMKALTQSEAGDLRVDATQGQIEALDDLIQTRYPLGGEMPIYREMMSSPS